MSIFGGLTVGNVPVTVIVMHRSWLNLAGGCSTLKCWELIGRIEPLHILWVSVTVFYRISCTSWAVSFGKG